MPKGGPPGVSGGVRWVQPPRVAQVMALGVSGGVRWVQPPRMAQVMALILTDDAGAATAPAHAGRGSRLVRWGRMGWFLP